MCENTIAEMSALGGRFHSGRGGRNPSDAGRDSSSGGGGRGGGGRGHSHQDSLMLRFDMKNGNFAAWLRRMVIDAIAEFPSKAEHLSYMTKVNGEREELIMPKLSDHVTVEEFGAVMPFLQVVPPLVGEVTMQERIEHSVEQERVRERYVEAYAAYVRLNLAKKEGESVYQAKLNLFLRQESELKSIDFAIFTFFLSRMSTLSTDMVKKELTYPEMEVSSDHAALFRLIRKVHTSTGSQNVWTDQLYAERRLLAARMGPQESTADFFQSWREKREAVELTKRGKLPEEYAATALLAALDPTRFSSLQVEVNNGRVIVPFTCAGVVHTCQTWTTVVVGGGGKAGGGSLGDITLAATVLHNNNTKSCWACNESGHTMKECPVLKAGKEAMLVAPAKSETPEPAKEKKEKAAAKKSESAFAALADEDDESAETPEECGHAFEIYDEASFVGEQGVRLSVSSLVSEWLGSLFFCVIVCLLAIGVSRVREMMGMREMCAVITDEDEEELAMPRALSELDESVVLSLRELMSQGTLMLLYDSGSTLSLVNSLSYFDHGSYQLLGRQKRIGGISSGGPVLTAIGEGYVFGRKVFYAPHAQASVIGGSALICDMHVTKTGRVRLDFEENKYVVDFGDGAERVFQGAVRPNGKHLYVYQMPRADVTLNTVEENMSRLQPRERAEAEAAGQLAKNAGFPSMRTMDLAIKQGALTGMGITSRSLHNFAQARGGILDEAVLKGNSKRRMQGVPESSISDCVVFQNQELHCDVFFVEATLAFLIMYATPMKHFKVVYLGKDKTALSMAAQIRLHAVWMGIGGNVATKVHFDDALDTAEAKGVIEAQNGDTAGPRLFIGAPGTHIPEAERAVETVKSQMRRVIAYVPFPVFGILIVYCALHAAFLLNLFPSTKTPNMRSAREQATGLIGDASVLLPAPFLSYAQISDMIGASDGDIRRMTPRTVGALYLCVKDSTKGSMQFLRLDTNKVVTRGAGGAKFLPMPTEVIVHMKAMAVKWLAEKKTNAFTADSVFHMGSDKNRVVAELEDVLEEPLEPANPLLVRDRPVDATIDDSPDVAIIQAASRPVATGNEEVPYIHQADDPLPVQEFEQEEWSDERSELEGPGKATEPVVSRNARVAARNDAGDELRDLQREEVVEALARPKAKGTGTEKRSVPKVAGGLATVIEPMRVSLNPRSIRTRVPLDQAFAERAARIALDQRDNRAIREDARGAAPSTPRKDLALCVDTVLCMYEECLSVVPVDICLSASDVVDTMVVGRSYDEFCNTAGQWSINTAMKQGPVEKAKSLAALSKELTQLTKGSGALRPVHVSELSASEKTKVMEFFAFFTDKHDPAGNFIKRKCRGVVNGSNQPRALFEDVSATTPSNSALFTFASIGAAEGMKFKQVDVPFAFLHCEMPLDKDGDRSFCKVRGELAVAFVTVMPELAPFLTAQGTLTFQLVKTVYGAIVSPKKWQESIRQVLSEYGMKPNPYEPNWYNLDKDGVRLQVIVWVDDVWMASTSMALMDGLVARIEAKYKVKLVVQDGDVIDNIGMRFIFDRKNKTVRVVMDEYLRMVTEGVGGTAPTPARNNLFEAPESPLLSAKDKKIFHSKVAQLLYLSRRSFYSIQLAVSYLTTRVQAPTAVDASKLIRVLKYLNGLDPREHELVLSFNARNPQIYAFIDASYAPDEHAKSQTGGVIALDACGGALYCTSEKQSIVTKSSTEAELVGLSNVASQVIYLQNVVRAQGYNMPPAIVYQDNQSAMAMMRNGSATAKLTRHINIRYFWLKDNVERGEVTIQYMCTTDMLADVLTKPLQGEQFTSMARRLLQAAK